MANRISGINAERIKWCCQLVAMDMQQLADATRVKVENLRRGYLTYNQLAKVAKFFGYTPLFFLADEPPVLEQVHTVAFRSLANQGVRLDRKLAWIIRQVESHRDLYLDLANEMNDDVVAFAPPRLAGDVARKAGAVRQWLGLDDSQGHGYGEYRELVEARGVMVFQSAGYRGDWKLQDSDAIGFSMPHPQTPIIFIKKTSPEMQTFTLFHELGHILLHKTGCIDSHEHLVGGHVQSMVMNEKELEANRFAGECLMPASELTDAIPDEAADYDGAFGDIASRRGISVEVVVVALAQRGRIGWDEYSAYRDIKERQRANWQHGERRSGGKRVRHREPVQIFGPAYVGTVMNALHEGVITISKASKYLDGLKVGDIRKLQEAGI